MLHVVLSATCWWSHRFWKHWRWRRCRERRSRHASRWPFPAERALQNFATQQEWLTMITEHTGLHNKNNGLCCFDAGIIRKCNTTTRLRLDYYLKNYAQHILFICPIRSSTGMWTTSMHSVIAYRRNSFYELRNILHGDDNILCSIAETGLQINFNFFLFIQIPQYRVLNYKIANVYWFSKISEGKLSKLNFWKVRKHLCVR